MLNRDEHDTLRQIELDSGAADPEFAALLRNGQRRLPRFRRRKLLQQALIALLLLLICVFLALGLPSSALAVGARGAGVKRLRRWPIISQRDPRCTSRAVRFPMCSYQVWARPVRDPSSLPGMYTFAGRVWQ